MPPPSVDAARKRDLFLRNIGSETPVFSLFDCLSEVTFFAKDRSFRLICASQRFVERFGFRDETQLIGKSDFDLFPPRLAESFRRDDEEVFRTGQSKRNIVELFLMSKACPIGTSRTSH